MSTRKALGAGHWAVEELRALPLPFLEGLASFLNMVEGQGCWPTPLQTTLVVMIPKEGAIKESEMRPIGLTPMIYRVWAKTRQPLISRWARQIYGPRYASATDCAWLTRVNQELAAHHRHSFGVV